MKFISLIINECIKIFKKKVTIIFFVISVISFLAAYGFMYLFSIPASGDDMNVSSERRVNGYIESWTQQLKIANDLTKADLQSKIEVYEFSLKNDVMLFANESWYKIGLLRTLETESLELNKIGKNNIAEYNKQKNKINEIKRIVEESDYDGYIKYQSYEIEEKYKNKEITMNEYIKQVNKHEQVKKYELGKKKLHNISWQETLVERNFAIDDNISRSYDLQRNEYLIDNKIKELENEKITNIYRLDNDIPTFELMFSRNNNLEENYADNINSYYRFQYSSFASTFAMFVIALLFIILASSTISEEISKGTIKFLIVTPFKRYKIIFAKIISLTITLIIITLIISQINVLVGNILFNAPNEYIYAENGVAKVLNTNIYETLQFLLKTPEIFIYMLFAMMLSTLLKNKIITNTITLITFLISNFIVMINSIFTGGIFNEIIKQNFMRYLPIANFDFISKILPIYNPSNNGSIEKVIINNTLEFSLIVLGITAFLLIFTMIESFNKKDM